MKKQIFLLCSLIFVMGNLLAEDSTIEGNLDVQGNVLNLGSWQGQTNEAGLSLNYADYPDDEYGEFKFSLNRYTAGWTWEKLGFNNNWLPMMRLSEDHSLVLYDSYGQWKIWLVPGGNNSVFQNSITVNGNNNVMPNQSLSADGSVLTRKLGDGRYVVKGSDKTSLGYATATGQTATAFGGDSLASGGGAIAGGESIATGVHSVALGEGCYASGNGSVALGNGAQATDHNTVALGYGSQAKQDYAFAAGSQSIASGSASVALGEKATASGELSFAMGGYVTASGYGSVAMGETVVASGESAFSFGLGTIAQGMNQVVVGRYNVPQGSAEDWVVTDNLFVVGNGVTGNQRSNAFTVKKNGDAVINGYATIKNAHVQGFLSSQSLAVAGPAEIMSDTSIEGNLSVGGAIWISPQGDLGMGTFNQ